jgi:phycoerythrin beta chain
MKSVITTVVGAADSASRFPTASDMESVQGSIQRASARLEAAEKLASNYDQVAQEAVDAVYAQYPNGGVYTNRKMAACLRDGEIVLRYVSYALLAGDASVLQDRCLNGLRETYAALGVPTGSASRAVAIMKAAAGALITNTNSQPKKMPVTTGDCSNIAGEAASYFDMVISAIS